MSIIHAEGTWKGKKVAVLYGGEGSEREISLQTGEAMASALEELGYEVRRVDVSSGALRDLASDLPDVALIAMHGDQGENGSLQGFLEVLGVPYTGSGVVASALAMNKSATKAVWRKEGLQTADWVTYTRTQIRDMLDAEALQMPVPCVVKPIYAGSSVGVSLVRKPEDARRALRRALRAAGPVMLEGLVEGREMSVALMDGHVMGIVEVQVPSGFYDYESKYESGDTVYRIPAPVSGVLHRRIVNCAMEAYRSIGVRGVARVDLIVDENDQPQLLEVNTVPGMTKTSLVPKLAQASGVSFEKLVDMILHRACLDVEADHM